ncbi:MAG: serine protease [Sandaracinaceae bacterium]|jgi:S1-C subfamily serine protease|nr:serine protease [Sandaracinaceae bacterium]
MLDSRVGSLALALVVLATCVSAAPASAQRRRAHATPSGPASSARTATPLAPAHPSGEGRGEDPRAEAGGPTLRERDGAAPGDLRNAHDRCVRSLVRILREDGGIGSGWVAELAGQRVVVTNAHVVAGVRTVRLSAYRGESALGHVRYVSPRIDLAIVVPEQELTTLDDAGERHDVAALEVAAVASLVRGERVVLGGNPGGLYFITTEGVVAGVVSDTHDSDEACGEGHNCVVLDGEGELGSSGGPVVDASGRVIGMLWGIYTGSSLSIAIHASTLQRELDLAALALASRRARALPRQPTIEP